MTIQEAIKNYVNRERKDRVIGRYWASEIYKIKKGYMSPKDFFTKRIIEEEVSIGNICQGIAGENFIKCVLDENKVPYTSQSPIEITLENGIIVSGKADFQFNNGVFEVKAPTRPLEEIPERYKDQLEAYWQAFKLPVYLCELKFNPFNVSVWPYESEPGRWEQSIEHLAKFHKKVQKYGEINRREDK